MDVSITFNGETKTVVIPDEKAIELPTAYGYDILTDEQKAEKGPVEFLAETLAKSIQEKYKQEKQRAMFDEINRTTNLEVNIQ